MENGTTTTTAPTVPYVSYVTFRNFIERISGHLPTRIDNSVMGALSGSAQSQLTIALRFLGLIGSSGEPTPHLKALAASWGKDDWAQKLANILSDAYRKVIGSVDLDHATGAELLEAFRERGGGGAAVAERAIRFYLKAMDDAKLTYSPHFKSRRSKTTRRTNSRKPRDGGDGGSGDNGHQEHHEKLDDTTPKGHLSIPIPFHGKPPGKIVVPEGLDDGDMAMVDAAVAMLKVWAKGKNGSKTK